MSDRAMNNRRSRVSIGIPVYNGESYLAKTLDSLLEQTFPNLEIIISDNASTDKTEEICAGFAARDQRIRYFRSAKNLGASWNFNRVFEVSSGEYFKWAAHDDLCDPELIERCVEVLDADKTVVLCQARTKAIDATDAVVREFPAKPMFYSDKAYRRFYQCVCVPHSQVAVFGLIRSNVLKKTRLIDNFSSSDRTLLGELILHGRFYEIPEFLFFKRHHSEQHWRRYPTRRSREEWYDPARAKKATLPHWRLLFEHIISIRRAPLSWYDRTLCLLCMGWWVRKKWRRLAQNLILRG